MTSRFTAVVNRMPLRKLTLATALALPGFLPIFAQAQTPVDPKHMELLDAYCVACHNQEDFSGGISFDLLDTNNVLTDAETWEKVMLKLEAGMMPPPGKERPEREEIERFVSSVANTLDSAWASAPNHGAKLLHRMNRREYQNAIRDLLDLPINAATLFPADSSSEGFDNLASVLSVSPALMQAYITVANKVSRLAVGDPTTSLTTVTYRADGQDQSLHLEGSSLGTRGGLAFTHVFPLDAEYEFRIARTGANAAFSLTPVGLEDPVEIVIDGERAALLPAGAPNQVKLAIPAGAHRIEATFVKTQAPRGVDDLHNVWADSTSVGSLAINGPMNASGPGDTPSRRRIFTCTPSGVADEENCARQILGDLAYRAYRRPVSDKAMDTIMAFYRDGREQRDFETGVQYGLARILVDPMFVFRFEEEPENLAPGESYELGPYELASRLSFFVWGSIPDDELLAAAASGALNDRAEQERQIDRMVKDPKAAALVENFAASWLGLAQLNQVNPVSDEFDGSLRVAMKRETELLLNAVITEDRPVTELLTADYTFVNERLAKHYGIPNIRGSHFRKVSLEGTGRHGLLGQGSILTVTSAPNRTSPVIRGAWIMDHILGTPPPPPPPGVEANLDVSVPESGELVTMRERLTQHRADPSCAACHNMMDPIGFALENFDAVGKFRDEADGKPVDATATFWDGTDFSGPDGLFDMMLARKNLFVQNVTEKLMTYALGRKVEYYDMPQVREVVRDTADEDFRFSALVREIALSEAFTKRTKEEAGAAEGNATAQR
ncbi:MAG TPA: DUF1592 domain-containing protein [Pseudomonadales bacterium]